MTTLTIVYHSGAGHTTKLAEAVAKGAASVAGGVNRLGSFAGATAQDGQESPEVAPNEADKLTGEILGRRVAEATRRWKAGKP